MDDRAIVELYLKGDGNAATEAAMKKYGSKLRRLAFEISGDRQYADECVQDAFTEAWLGIPPNKPYDHLFPYLARITRHVSLDRVKSEKAKKRSTIMTELTKELAECIPSGESVEDEAVGRELKKIINGFLSGLVEDKRSIFIRRYWFFDPVKDIAKRFGTTQGNIRTILFRLRGELKEHLSNNGYEV
ncbi:MAG: RNA polymerase sigma factor [Clostridia bacterium]|nr:RNA polymerase sigma factor [Clostridia bacterium]